eukprot:gene108-8696_t
MASDATVHRLDLRRFDDCPVDLRFNAYAYSGGSGESGPLGAPCVNDSVVDHVGKARNALVHALTGNGKDGQPADSPAPGGPAVAAKKQGRPRTKGKAKPGSPGSASYYAAARQLAAAKRRQRGARAKKGTQKTARVDAATSPAAAPAAPPAEEVGRGDWGFPHTAAGLRAAPDAALRRACFIAQAAEELGDGA